jgi:hypothetical protein
MKKIVFIGILCLSLLHFKASAQSGFSEGTVYQNQYSVDDIPVGQPYYRYNQFGQIIGVFQQWEYAEWHSSSGGSYVNVWGSNGWESTYVNGTYWWYKWVIYEKRIQ